MKKVGAIFCRNPLNKLIQCVKKSCHVFSISLEQIRDLGGGFKHFLFSSLFGEDSQFDEHIFQMGWFNHQPEIHKHLDH